MNCLVLQYDTRSWSSKDEMVHHNTRYAQAAGYEHRIEIGDPAKMPPWWGKVSAVLEFAKTKDFDAILFIDTDAAVMDWSLRVEELVQGDVLFAGSGVSGSYNTGVFAIRCNHDGIRMLEEWMGLYDQGLWRFEDGLWRTNGNWAGTHYEQGSFNASIAPRYWERIKDVGWKTFLHCDHHRTAVQPTIRDLQRFVAAMSQTRVIHLCGLYRDFFMTHIRSGYEGRLVFFDQTAEDLEGERKRAAIACREVLP